MACVRACVLVCMRARRETRKPASLHRRVTIALVNPARNCSRGNVEAESGHQNDSRTINFPHKTGIVRFSVFPNTIQQHAFAKFPLPDNRIEIESPTGRTSGTNETFLARSSDRDGNFPVHKKRGRTPWSEKLTHFESHAVALSIAMRATCASNHSIVQY